MDAAFVGAPLQNVNLSLNDDGCLIVRSRAVAETYWPEQLDLAWRRDFSDERPGGIERRWVFMRGRRAIKSTSPAANYRRKPSKKLCSLTRRSANVSSLESQPRRGTHGNHRCVSRGGPPQRIRLKQFLLQHCPPGRFRANGILSNRFRPTRAAKFRVLNGGQYLSGSGPNAFDFPASVGKVSSWMNNCEQIYRRQRCPRIVR